MLRTQGSRTLLTHPTRVAESLPSVASQIYAANSMRTDLLLLIGAIYYQLGNYEQVHILRPNVSCNQVSRA